MKTLQFDYLNVAKIEEILPLMQDFTNHKYSDSVLLARLKAMFDYDYACVGIYLEAQLIGFCGMWFQTRHYSGKSCELDHFYIDTAYQGRGYGQQFLDWVEKELIPQGYEAIELNVYKENTAAHRFYEREGFKHLGLHYVKRINRT